MSTVLPEHVVILRAFRGRHEESWSKIEVPFDLYEELPFGPWLFALGGGSTGGAGVGSANVVGVSSRGLLSIWRFGAGSRDSFSSSESSSRRKPGFPRGRDWVSACGVGRFVAVEGELVG